MLPSAFLALCAPAATAATVALGACSANPAGVADAGHPEAIVEMEASSPPPLGAPPEDDGGVFDPTAPSGPPGTVTVSDAGADVDPSAAYAVTIAVTPFTVPAGGEVYKCQNFANPFGGQAVDINRYELTMSAGSHHMLLLYEDGAADGPLIDCPSGGLETGPFTFGAQSPKATAAYPAGIGAAIPASMGFTVDAHYLNTTAQPIDASLVITMYVAQPGTVTQHAGSIQFVLTSLSVPPTNMPYVVNGSCPVAQDLNLLWASSHMHQRATNFVATSGTTTLYQTTQWSEPVAQTFSPPLPLASGSTVDWSCTYVNDTGSTLTFGPSAEANVMCNFGAAFFPVSDPSNPLVQCLQ